MKKIVANGLILTSVGILSFIAATFFLSCSGIKITGVWKNPKQPLKAYGSMCVASLTSNNIARATIENDMAGALEKQGITAYKSMDEFPPGVKKDSLTKEDILSRMRNKKTESRYVQEAGTPYTPFPRYPYYADFSGYYSYWYPYAYNPSYYGQDKTYYIETNLYDSATEQLVWSAQSRTYNPSDLKGFSKEFRKIIVAKLKEDGMLKLSANLSSKQ